MPPSLALLLWLVLIVWLFWFDPAKEPGVSAALWVPLTWLFFMGSRQPAQWLDWNIATAGSAVAEALEEGNPVNRTLSLIFLFFAVAVLVSRYFRWGDFFARNRALTAYLLFALLSVLWSDFPLPAFRKWFRDLSSYVMVLVVVSDPCPLEAVRTLLRRLGYLLIPLSVVLIKYFPALARQYDPWTGGVTYSGATTSKNMLGILCLVCGIYFFWDIVVRWPDRKDKQQKRIILVNAGLIYMIVWLLNTCSSVTSITCLVIASLVILAAHSKAVQRRPRILTVTIPCVFLLYVFLAFGLGLKGDFAEAVGRDSTLSGRTEIWEIVLSQHTNPLLGAGYESFWMGPRLERIWASGMGEINEAHNGYLEVYLNLGYVGLFLLLSFAVAVYRNICKRLKPFSSIASLALAIWTVFLFHNCTEVDFRSGLMWVVFVLAALAVSEVGREEVSETAVSSNAATAEELVPPFRSDWPETAIAQPSRWV
ncbi:MAG: O-antigen ligase family protein [Candidatus Korobacteraceae bacterium]